MLNTFLIPFSAVFAGELSRGVENAWNPAIAKQGAQIMHQMMLNAYSRQGNAPYSTQPDLQLQPRGTKLDQRPPWVPKEPERMCLHPSSHASYSVHSLHLTFRKQSRACFFISFSSCLHSLQRGVPEFLSTQSQENREPPFNSSRFSFVFFKGFCADQELPFF